MTDSVIFQTFRKEGKYSDYPLQINNAFYFKLHRDIISKRSNFFKGMFNSGFQVSNAIEITNRYIGLEKWHFDVVFDYLYGKELPLNEYSYTDMYCIYTIAEYLAVDDLLLQIQTFITNKLSGGLNMYDEINDNFNLFLERIIFYYLLLANTNNKRYVYTLLSACKNVVNEMTETENEKMNRYIEFNIAMKKILPAETYLEFAGHWKQNITLENIINNSRVRECLLLNVFDFQDLMYSVMVPSVQRFNEPTLIKNNNFTLGSRIFCTQEEFMRSFMEFTYNIPTLITKYWDNICISGGSIARLLNNSIRENPMPSNADVDIFIFGKTLEERQATCNYLVAEVFEKNFPGKCWYTIKRAVMTVTVQGIPRQFQIICTSAKTNYQIVDNFDLTHVQMLYQNGNVYATPDAILSHLYMTSLIKKNSIFASRLHKALLDGFKLVFPKIYNVFIWNGEKSEKFKFSDLQRLTMTYLAECKNTKDENSKFYHPTTDTPADIVTANLLTAFKITPEQLTNNPQEALSKVQIRNNFIGDMMLNYGNTNNILDYKNINIPGITFGVLNGGQPRKHINSVQIAYGGTSDGIRFTSPMLPFPKQSFDLVTKDINTNHLRNKYIVYVILDNMVNNPEYLRFYNFCTEFNNHVIQAAISHPEWFETTQPITTGNNDARFQNPFKHKYANMRNPSMKFYLTTKNFDSVDCLFVDTYGNIIFNHTEAFSRAKLMEAVIKINRIWLTGAFKYGYSFVIEKIILHFDPDQIQQPIPLVNEQPPVAHENEADSIDEIDELLE
jgi:BTB/POZ domain